MTNPVLRLALACAEHGWPVFPCQPGRKTPATRHGYLDATTDPAQISEWFARHPDRNLAVATGAPGPDVLDIDYRGPAGSGFPALARLRAAGLLDGAAASVRTPSGGLHVYFAGSSQRSGHLPAATSTSSPAAATSSSRPPRSTASRTSTSRPSAADGGLDWHAAARLLEPSREHRQRPAAPPTPGEQVERAGPLGRRPARGQPQRRPVLGRQPRPGNRPGRRPQPPGRRRPPGRARRTRDHPHPQLRPPHQPGPAANRPTARPKERADMTSQTPARPPAAPAHPPARPQPPGDSCTRARRTPGPDPPAARRRRHLPVHRGRRRPGPRHRPRPRHRPPQPHPGHHQGPAEGHQRHAAPRPRRRGRHPAAAAGPARHGPRLGPHRPRPRRPRDDHPPASSAATPPPSAARLRDAVTDLYDAWWDKRAPERTRAERAAATAARRRAIAGNWCAGAGLDDDELDTPGYKPKSNWKPATGTGTAPDIHPPAKPRKNNRPMKNRNPQTRNHTPREPAMSLNIQDDIITANHTSHTARRLPGDQPLWEVSWLPGQPMNRNHAVAAMVLADLTKAEEQTGHLDLRNSSACAAKLLPDYEHQQHAQPVR